MKKIIGLVFVCSYLILPVFADETNDVRTFFDEFVNAANNYSENYFDYFSDNAKIIRVVEKPDGTQESVNIPISRYKQEAKRSNKLMKLRKYKNRYFNIRISKQGKDYKISALRMPSTSDYKIPAHFVVGKDNSGDWKIKEESMNTRVQSFLKRE